MWTGTKQKCSKMPYFSESEVLLKTVLSVSVTFLAGHGEICPAHGGPQSSPQHADPYGLGAFSKTTIQEIHVDRRVVGWSAGRHVDHPCAGQISPWPARKVTECFLK